MVKPAALIMALVGSTLIFLTVGAPALLAVGPSGPGPCPTGSQFSTSTGGVFNFNGTTPVTVASNIPLSFNVCQSSKTAVIISVPAITLAFNQTGSSYAGPYAFKTWENGSTSSNRTYSLPTAGPPTTLFATYQIAPMPGGAASCNSSCQQSSSSSSSPFSQPWSLQKPSLVQIIIGIAGLVLVGGGVGVQYEGKPKKGS